MHRNKIISDFTKADPGPRIGRVLPRLKNLLGLFFVNFDCITHIYFNCSQHAMFPICIRDHAPAGFEISGSATVLDFKATEFQKCLTHIGVGKIGVYGDRDGCGESCPPPTS